MTIREFVELSNGSVTVVVMQAEETICEFDSAYWNFMSDEVLDMEIESFEIECLFLRKARARVYIPVPVDETEEQDEEPDDEDEPDEDETEEG